MFEYLAKNLWVLVTIMLPGMFTYGIWRLLLILNPSSIIQTAYLTQIDELNVLTWCIIIAIALLQQSVGLVIEFVLFFITRKKKMPLSNYHLLFHKRFKLANKNKITDYANSVISNLFLSINIFVGLLFLLIYFLFFENLEFQHWIICVLIFFTITVLLNVFFRIQTSLKVIKK
ncbi:hypothetical protein [Polaribacter sp. Hel1_85]|uniref:hypothetical protein n=1 Tax=Polaribacter sp. Hel1_85 TaxID=1250005 RepID=UPI00052DB354|nr:hypothetical protein [Polaribacter sp. Hel1_85]KGL58782.1 conserved hypothetical membrane protein [Polaribacter sp. Hel1_85]